MRTRLLRLASLLLLPLCSTLSLAQGGPGGAGQAARPPLNQAEDPLLRGLQWRVIGPIGQGGRVNDTAVVESDPTTFYIGFATGGIWKTSNRGVTFEPVFDTYGTHSIGDLAVAPSDPNVVYVGTGEPNNRQSSSFGDGIYKSTDGGKSFTNLGLRETQTIARVVVHPRDPNTVWVAALGYLFGPNAERGDGGATWTEVGKNLPGGGKEYYVSRVEASYHDPATAYVSLDGHRSDDLKPYLYVTRDYGKTWTAITENLPAFGNLNTVKQDPKNPKLLYAGTEFGFYVSFDEGESWKRLMSNLPVVRIDDVLIHPRDNDLVLSTHGRSIWIMDDVTALQQLTPQVLAADAHLFEPRETVLWKQDIRLRRSVTDSKPWRGESAPAGTAISYHLKSAASGPVRITISDPAGAVFRTLEGTTQAGLNLVRWDLCSDRRPLQAAPAGGGGGGGGFGGGFGGGCGGGGFGGGGGGGGGGQAGPPQVARMATPGEYRVTLAVGGKEYTRTVKVVEDNWMEQR